MSDVPCVCCAQHRRIGGTCLSVFRQDRPVWAEFETIAFSVTSVLGSSLNGWGPNMNYVASILVALVAALHIYFLVLEMFLWTKPKGLKTFGNTLEKAQASAVLAANQGLYNGFLAAGLIWGLVHPNVAFGFQIKVFFLLCVIVAGLYGAYSVSKRIIMVQALPAAIALILLWLTRSAT